MSTISDQGNIEKQENNESTSSQSTQHNTESSPKETEITQKNEQPQCGNVIEESKEVKAVEKLVSDLTIEDENEKNDEAHEEGSEVEDKSAKESESELLDDTKYFVEISKQSIPFGKNVLFPGSIEEVDVSIGLKDDSIYDPDNNDPYMLRVIAKCSNQEFDSLDEYVFSVRSNDRFEYFEEVRFKIKRNEKAHVKVAVKIPPVKENYTLAGILEIQLEGLKPVCLPITGKCEVPQINCMKDLYKSDEQCSMIKVPAKKNQIRMPPIPFKNMSNFNFTLEVETITNENFSNRAYDIVCQNFVSCQSNMQFFVNLQLKENINFKGVVPARDTIRKILVLKIKNSSVYFNYPLEVNIYEGSNAGGMS